MQLCDLINREYRGKECVAFEQVLYDHEGNELLRASFRRHDEDNIWWRMLIVLNGTDIAAPQVYVAQYSMPSKSMGITLVAATGLRYMQATLAEEVQAKCAIDFAIGEVTNGM